MITFAKETLPPAKHAWKKCICVGRAYDLLQAELQNQLRFLQREIGYRYIRFHAVLHDDVGVCHRGSDGKLVYRWTQLDRIFDFLVEAGFDPIVELQSMPGQLASGEQTMFWYKMNITPPKRAEEWQELVAALTRHFVERYGQERVRRWMFEVWNEPNLPGFFSGSQDDYFEMYDAAVRGVKGVDDQLKVGGPAGAGGDWNVPLLLHCRDNGVPIDFVSCHDYPQGEYCTYPRRQGSPHAAGMAMVNDFRKWRGEMDAVGYSDMTLIVTEWNTQICGDDGTPRWLGNMNVSTLIAGAAAAHYAVNCDPFLDVMGWWVASDIFEECGPHWEPYGGNNQYYGMLTTGGLPKPAFHAFKWLGRLSGDRMRPLLPETHNPLQGMLVTRDAAAIRGLLWNFHMPEESTSVWEDLLILPVSENGKSRVVTALVKEGQGSAYEAWEEMGRPANLTRLEGDMLAARSLPEYSACVKSAKDGAIEVSFRLDRNDLFYFEILDAGDFVENPQGEVRQEIDKALDV